MENSKTTIRQITVLRNEYYMYIKNNFHHAAREIFDTNIRQNNR
jgi:hypothetical protein